MASKVDKKADTPKKRGGGKRHPKVDFFQGDDDGQWYWHAAGGNGEISCRAEGYSTRSNAKRGFLTAKRIMAEIEL